MKIDAIDIMAGFGLILFSAGWYILFGAGVLCATVGGMLLITAVILSLKKEIK
jgi:hypothetical protein